MSKNMNENQRDTEHRPDEGKQVQQELERQLREFGDTMSDAFRHGFEGRGEEIGDRVWDVGRAAVDAANYGINAAGRAVREGQQACQRQAEKAARAAGGSGAAWARQFFARKPEPTPVENIRASAKKRHNAGVALLAVGITFAVIFGISAISCFGAAAMFAPSTLLGDAVATEGDVITQVFVAGGEAIGSFAMGAIRVSGWAFTAITALFGWMTAAGASRMRAGKKLNLYADMAEEFDYQKGLSLEMLADLPNQKKQTALKALRGYIHRGWLSAWLDEKDEKLYLTAEDYRAAQEARKAAVKISDGSFGLDDFLDQLQQVRKLGPMKNLLGMIPGMAAHRKELEQFDEREIDRTEAIIRSMTPAERRDPSIIDGSRRARIAYGSGVTVSQVNALLQRCDQAAKMMRRMSNKVGAGVPGFGGPAMGGGKGKGKGKKNKKKSGKSGNPMKREAEEKALRDKLAGKASGGASSGGSAFAKKPQNPALPAGLQDMLGDSGELPPNLGGGLSGLLH